MLQSTECNSIYSRMIKNIFDFKMGEWQGAEAQHFCQTYTAMLWPSGSMVRGFGKLVSEPENVTSNKYLGHKTLSLGKGTPNKDV